MDLDKEKILDEYGAAVICAMLSFAEYKPHIDIPCEMFVDDEIELCGKKIKCKSSNPEFTEERRRYYDDLMDEYSKEEDEFIYNYLKENYGDTDYAERFKKNKIK